MNELEQELPGFVGSREHIILSAYLAKLSPEQRDRVITAPKLDQFGWDVRRPDRGPCLVQAAEAGHEEPEGYWGLCAKDAKPVAMSCGRQDVYPWTAFDLRAHHGEPFIRWLKAECARLNGSTASEISALTRQSAPVAT